MPAAAAHDAGWGLGEADWNVDQDQGEIVFTRADGITATAPVQIVGTYNTEIRRMAVHAKRVRDYGKQHGIKRLTTRKLGCSEDDAWELAAVACKLCEAQGAYRGPAGTAFVFLTFGEVTLSK